MACERRRGAEDAALFVSTGPTGNNNRSNDSVPPRELPVNQELHVKQHLQSHNNHARQVKLLQGPRYRRGT